MRFLYSHVSIRYFGIHLQLSRHMAVEWITEVNYSWEALKCLFSNSHEKDPFLALGFPPP